MLHKKLREKYELSSVENDGPARTNSQGEDEIRNHKTG
jgi:hypothetical protein